MSTEERGAATGAAGRLEGRVALVSGGARGIGAAHVRALAGEGAHVLIGDVREEEGAALAAELGERVAPVASLELPEDPAALAWAVAAIAPLGPVDRHHVLIAPSLAARLALLQQLLAEQEDVLRFRLSQDD